MNSSMNNFREHPIAGIGLGVPSFYESAIVEKFVVRFQGIPVSATVEKGFLPTAVLEEIGLIGAALTLLLIFTISITILRYGQPWVIWVYLTAMLQNAGEAVLFSPGGKGLLIWSVVGFCYLSARDAAASQRQRASAPILNLPPASSSKS
jgi:hypothetical protein